MISAQKTTDAHLGTDSKDIFKKNWWIRHKHDRIDGKTLLEFGFIMVKVFL